jgi:TIR domain
MRPYVVISYSRADQEYVERLAAHLRAQGVEVWLDDQVQSGESFAHVVGEHIRECAAMIVVASAKATDSAWLEREIMYAQQRAKPILPLVLDQVRLPFVLADVPAERVAGRDMPTAAFVAKLRELVASSSPLGGPLAPAAPAFGAPVSATQAAYAPVPLQPAPDANAYRGYPASAPPPGGFPAARRRRKVPFAYRHPQPAIRDRLAFTAAYPPSVAVGDWYSLLVLLHGEAMGRQVSALLKQWAPKLGGDAATSTTTASGAITRGTTLTLVPSADGVAFNPASVEVTWQEDVQEVPFRFRVHEGRRHESVAGQIEVAVGPLLVAVVPFGLMIAEHAPSKRSLKDSVSHARVFDTVFASYSRRDEEVVRACTDLYRAMGVTVLVDQADLRAGDEWKRALHDMINKADVFQLYWSTASSASTEVDTEWRYALGLGKGMRFIRPVYWQTPMPLPPRELEHVHFSHIDLDTIKRLPRRGLERTWQPSVRRWRRWVAATVVALGAIAAALWITGIWPPS